MNNKIGSGGVVSAIRARWGVLRFLIAACLLSFIGLASPAYSDEIPQRVSIQAFIKPEGDKLNLLMRVPMDAMGGIQWPLRGEIGFLIFSQAEDAKADAAYNTLLRSIQIFEDDRLLVDPTVEASRIALPSNRGFTDYQSALSTVNSETISDDVNLYFRQGFLDILATYPIESEDSRFAIDPRLGTLGLETTTVLRYVLPEGEERAFSYIGNPGRVNLDPRWYQAMWNFISLGFVHILEGADHLLFLFCLLIPLRDIRALIPVVTSFTVAHSITLIASALGWVPSAIWFPSLIESLIALSIVYMALENIFGVKQEHRWLVTFGFGLVHGFGFSFLLTESMQFAGSHLLASLLAFNLGVEFGQILVLLIAVPLIGLAFKYVLPERMGVIVLSALVAHWAWHWMEERFGRFFAYDLSLPAMDRYFFTGLMQWVALLLLAGGVLWLMQNVFARYFVSAQQGRADDPANVTL